MSGRRAKRPRITGANATPASRRHTDENFDVWMGDVDALWTEAQVLDLWRRAGEQPVRCKVFHNDPLKPAYCFVTFSSIEAAKTAMKRNRQPIPGTHKKFKLKWTARGQPGAEHSVFVGDLDTAATELQVFAAFDDKYAGCVKLVKIMTTAEGRSRGFGFVRFSNAQAQQGALQTMHGALVAGKPIKVALAPTGAIDEPQTTEVYSNAKVPQAQPKARAATNPLNTTVQISGVTRKLPRDELVAHLQPFGDIIYCRVNYNALLAHVKFLLRPAAERALLFLHGACLNGNRLKLAWGRDAPTRDSKINFSPYAGGDEHTGSAPPAFAGALPVNVVFEDLTVKKARDLDYTESTARDMDRRLLERWSEREAYLLLAF